VNTKYKELHQGDVVGHPTQNLTAFPHHEEGRWTGGYIDPGGMSEQYLSSLKVEARGIPFGLRGGDESYFNPRSREIQFEMGSREYQSAQGGKRVPFNQGGVGLQSEQRGRGSSYEIQGNVSQFEPGNSGSETWGRGSVIEQGDEGSQFQLRGRGSPLKQPPPMGAGYYNNSLPQSYSAGQIYGTDFQPGLIAGLQSTRLRGMPPSCWPPGQPVGVPDPTGRFNDAEEMSSCPTARPNPGMPYFQSYPPAELFSPRVPDFSSSLGSDVNAGQPHSGGYYMPNSLTPPGK